MTEDAAFLSSLLPQASGADWAGRLSAILQSDTLRKKPDNPQSCTVEFALAQARRRLAWSKTSFRPTFGLEGLVQTLSHLPEASFLSFYSVANHEWTGTCYLHGEVLLGCEFVLSSP